MARDYPLELFADDIAGVIYGPRNCKVVFTSQRPSPDKDAAEAEVLTLVMPTDSLISFCIYTLNGFATHGEPISEHAQELQGKLSKALDAVQTLARGAEFARLKEPYIEAKPSVKAPARKRTKAKSH